ncbi:hypothetical protein DSO57_1003811 [Entomophthora muscae]|uniref:Uncharacterized protein n=1 Tax=Entomophthora muscae TaxID=34485 RepID=A0ACC2UJC2_9FUNG|nr:hypothetical protein DSO57_1003811 [Entomophthora muscae]
MEPDSSSIIDPDFVNSTRLVYQAGVDFESKPVVVFCASSLPPPSKVDHDLLLEMILRKLDEFVENDYTCVMFVGGNIHRPSWPWLLRAYRQLGRKYKKNLKNLYVVHPSLWVRLLMDMMNKIISPKFARKVTWIKTLSELANFVPLSNMTIPAAVYDHNRKFETEVVFNSSGRGLVSEVDSRVFGLPLSGLMGENGENGLPAVVIQCMEFVLANGQEEEGVFRRSPSSVLLKEAKKLFDEEKTVDLETYGVHVAAVLLKVFTRELPEPVFPASLYSVIEQMTQNGDQDKVMVDYLAEELVPRLSIPTQLLLHYICSSLNTFVGHSRFTRMTSQNLAVVWAPNLLRSGNPVLDVTLCSAGNGPTVGNAFRLAIEYPEAFFRNVTQTQQNQSPPPKPPRVQSS